MRPIGGKMTRAATQAAASPVSPAPDERYLNREQLRVLIPASDMTLWRWQRDPDIAFPAPVKLGADGRNYWWLPTIRAWIRQREERSVERPAGRPGRHI
jgi:predicted DNA-binding transcriptional regulator AlpA